MRYINLHLHYNPFQDNRDEPVTNEIEKTRHDPLSSQMSKVSQLVFLITAAYFILFI